MCCWHRKLEYEDFATRISLPELLLQPHKSSLLSETGQANESLLSGIRTRVHLNTLISTQPSTLGDHDSAVKLVCLAGRIQSTIVRQDVLFKLAHD